MKKKIGMAGIGLMGHGIAGNLLKHGHSLALQSQQSQFDALGADPRRAQHQQQPCTCQALP
jgi:3-hydroxyisobutyrate dehydrogenase-like beta-hydroxyacid dehydrogenase